LGSLFPKKRCHPEPFLCPRQRQTTTTLPAGIKRVQDLAELLRQPKGHAQATIAFFLGSIIQKKRCHPEPFLCPRQRQTTTTLPAGIKRVKDLAELLRQPKGHAQATIAFFLGSIIQKKRCHPEPFLCPRQRQTTTTLPAGIKRVKDLAELLRRPKGRAQ
jgi:hypothetical protein